jgi:hypothetical protein
MCAIGRRQRLAMPEVRDISCPAEARLERGYSRHYDNGAIDCHCCIHRHSPLFDIGFHKTIV